MRIARMIASLFLAAFLLLLPCLLLIDHAVPVFGYSFHVINTASMYPEITMNDVVIVRRCETEKVQDRDIVMLYINPYYLLRRAVQITELDGEVWLAAKGNWSSSPEPEIISDQNLLGKVTGRLPGLGLAIGFMRTGLGTILMLLFCWAAAVVIVLPMLRKRRKSR